MKIFSEKDRKNLDRNLEKNPSLEHFLFLCVCVKVSSLLSFNNKREKKKKRNEIPIKSPQQTTYRATDTRTICLTLNATEHTN